MGWSCTAKASLVERAITETIKAKFPAISGSNSLPDGGFWEISRKEHADGAITGTVWKSVGENLVTKSGSFKISPEGKIVRFPRLSADIKAAAEKAGAAEYARIYEGGSANV